MKGTVTYWQLKPHDIGKVQVRGGLEVEIRAAGAVRKSRKPGIFVPSDTFRTPVKIGEKVEIPTVREVTLGATMRTDELKYLDAPVWIRER